MKIVFYAYRDWAIDIFKSVNQKEKYLISNIDYAVLENINPDLVFFIGWSNIIPNNIINKYTCICLHPSPLPKYRGGSPIQNQIINGEKDSATTFFIMDEGLDTGDILYQEHLDLSGELSDIFERIQKSAIKLIPIIIEDFKNETVIKIKQDNSKSTLFKRRKEKDSEITIDEILNSDPVYLYNKIRSLADPYPNAYIRCKDGKKLFILNSKYDK